MATITITGKGLGHAMALIINHNTQAALPFSIVIQYEGQPLLCRGQQAAFGTNFQTSEQATDMLALVDAACKTGGDITLEGSMVAPQGDMGSGCNYTKGMFGFSKLTINGFTWDNRFW